MAFQMGHRVPPENDVDAVSSPENNDGIPSWIRLATFETGDTARARRVCIVWCRDSCCRKLRCCC